MIKKLHLLLPLVGVLLFLSHWASGQCNVPFPPGLGPQACQNAPLFCSEADFDGYCTETGATGVGICPTAFCGSCENYNWYSFVANSATIQIQITPNNCNAGTGMGDGIQAHMYQTNDCVNFTPVSNCESPGVSTPIIVTANNLVPGQIYYLMIDGWAGDICEYSMEVLQGIGTVPVPVIPGPIVGPTQVCPGAEVTYTVPAAFGASDYDWTLTPSIGSISGNGENEITISFSQPGGVATLCVTPSNQCEIGPPVCTTIFSVPIPPTILTAELCLGESVECGGITYSAPGSYSTTYESYLGCDSVVQCNILPLQPDFEVIQETICAPDCYTLGSTTYCNTGGYTQVFTNQDGCDSVVNLILIVLEAEAVIASPPTIGCGAASTVTLDGTGSTTVPQASGATITYNWTASGGGNIVGPNDMNTVDVNAPGTYTLTVAQTFGSLVCEDVATVVVVEDAAVPDPPSLAGEDVVCQLDNETYTVTPAGTMPMPTGYTWTVIGGTFVDNGTSIDVDWTGFGMGQVCVTSDNDCGSSAQVCLDVTIGAIPLDPVLVGGTTFCEGDMGVIFEVNPVEPGVTYTWSVTGGASFTDNGSSITVDFSDAMDGQVCVVATNSCGDSQNNACIDFTVGDVPMNPTILGDDELCDGESGVYTVLADPNVDTYTWTVPNGEPFVGQGTNGITVDWTGSTGGQVCLTVANSCGSPASPTCFAVTVNPLPTATISGSGSFCTGDMTPVDLTINLTGTAPWDVTYEIDGMTPTTITINASPFTLSTNTPGAYTLTDVSDANGCVGTAGGTGTVIENPLPTAILSGSGDICAGSGDCIPLTVDLTGTPNWTIVIAINGVNQAPITGIMSSPYMFDACQGADFTITSVTDGNGCNAVGTGTSTIGVNTAPVVSNIMRTCDPTNTTYTVTFEISSGDPASYTVDGGTAGISAGPPFVYTSAPIPNGGNYSFVVDDANGCNPVIVDGTFLCDCTTDVGTMDQMAQQACGMDCILSTYDNTNEVLDGDDIQEFILHEGSGITVVNPIATNTIPEFCYDGVAGMVYGQTYYISAIVGNDNGGNVDLTDPCLAVAQGTPVVFFEEPTGTLSGDATICIGESTDLSVAFTGAAPWSIVYDDGAGNLDTIVGINANPFTLTVNPTATSTFCLVTVNNANCPGVADGCADITVNEPPVVDNISTDCNTTSTAFTVTFEISGGDAGSYEVLPAGSGVITPGTPAVFTSNEIPTNSTYFFQVTDTNGCDTIEVSTNTPVVCDCTTQVGDMDPTAFDICGDGPVQGIYDDTNEVLDGNDVVEFILHNGSGNTIGYPIIDQNFTGEFSFDTNLGMTYGTTYYISAIVGNDDGTGSVDDMNDPCLSVAPGTPVTFFQVPTATISGTADICLGDAINLPVSLTGDSPWTIVIENSVTGVLDTVSGINSTTFNYNVSPTETTTYTLIEVNDENCPGTVAGAPTVTVNVAPTASLPVITINPANTGYEVCFTISGGEAPYTVIGTGGINVTVDSTFCSNEIPCGNGYSFTVDDGNMCGPVIVEDPMVLCDCQTAVGEMDQTPIEICGNGPAIAIYDPTLEFLDGNDVVDFILHNGDFVPIQTNTVPEFSFTLALTYGTTYFISARAGDNNGSGNVSILDPCLQQSVGTPVVFNQVPSAQLSGGGDICIGECMDLDLNITGGVGPYTVIYQNGSGVQDTITAPSGASIITVCPTNSTVFSLVSVEDANCPGTVSGLSAVTLQGVPFGANIVTTIDANNEFVTVCFDIVGGDTSTYVVTGGPGTITGSVFCSDPIPCSAGSYFYLVQDGFACITDTVQGPIICNCVSSAGVMSNSAVTLCEFETVTVDTAFGVALDGNDAFLYALHTSTGPMLGTIIATNTAPTFDYDPVLMNCDETYYISTVVGNDDGTGMVDLTDSCLSVANGTPVFFHCLPTASITGSTALCAGASTPITFSLSGEGPFNIVVNVNGVDTTLMLVDDMDQWLVSPTENTTYTLVSVDDLTTGCFDSASESVTITVNEAPFAGMDAQESRVCEGETLLVDLFAQILDEDAGGTWTETSANPSVGGAFNAGAGTFSTTGQAAGTYQFTYTVLGVDPCPDDAISVQVIVDPLPIADAGDDQDLTCDVLIANLGGNSTTGANIVYEWLDEDGEQVSTASTFTTDVEGIYTLTVMDEVTGCSSTDQVEVMVMINELETFLTVSDVGCFGDSDGSFNIDSIAGGVEPYLCSLNGSPFTSQKLFTNLGAGSYTLVVMDANGCEDEITFLISQPDELDVELIGNWEGEEGEMILGDSLQLNIITNVGFENLDTIIWSPSELISCDTCESVYVMPTSTTNFSIMVESNGCTDSDDLRVLVRKTRPVYIPNGFSPNGDLSNDIFYIQAGPSVVKINSFLVFNRWGETVYQYYDFLPNDPAFGWDGTHRGQAMNPGVFVYYAEIEFTDGLVELYKGDVILVR